jgi:hypothetical protein
VLRNFPKRREKRSPAGEASHAGGERRKHEDAQASLPRPPGHSPTLRGGRTKPRQASLAKNPPTRTLVISVSDILEDCEKLSRGVPIEDRRADLESLMRFQPNLEEPVHRWVNYKEGFSGDLVVKLLSEHLRWEGRCLSFLDPFCGVGTSLLAAEEFLEKLAVRSGRLRGVEVNPYAEFAARTKLSWNKYDPALLMRVAAISTNGLRLPQTPALPTLSTIKNPKFISPNALRQLVDLREKIRLAAKGRPELKPLLLGLASAAERIFKLRKDGRALRYTPGKEEAPVLEEAMKSWLVIAEDLQLGKQRRPVDYKIAKGDGRRVDRIFRERFDVILFSPPYLNNIDYTEVYKIELWLLGFLKTSRQMLEQRRRTFRSHPSCLFPSAEDASCQEAATTLGIGFERLSEYASYKERWRGRLFTEYFADMLRTLRGCRRLITPRGKIFLIVGNSLHGNAEHPIPVATDLWTCKLASAAGLRVEALLVARQLPRRNLNTTLMRESVIVLSAR